MFEWQPEQPVPKVERSDDLSKEYTELVAEASTFEGLYAALKQIGGIYIDNAYQPADYIIQDIQEIENASDIEAVNTLLENITPLYGLREKVKALINAALMQDTQDFQQAA